MMILCAECNTDQGERFEPSDFESPRVLKWEPRETGIQARAVRDLPKW
jgi:hypothetical protein